MKIKVNIKFDREKYAAKKKRVVKTLVLMYWRMCQQLLSTPNTGVRHKRQQATSRGKKGSQYTTYDNPSKPGEAPHARTGFGRGHVVHEIDKDGNGGRVGIRGNALYMLYLDLGTSRVKRRPWLLTPLQKNKGELAAAAMAAAKG